MAIKKVPWREFEELVARIQRALAPAAEVRHNDRIVGRLTGTKRQVDVSIRQTVGPHKLLVIVDCKNLKHAADVKDVEEVIGLAQDVGANKAAIVSAKGFTEAARTRAHQAGLDALRLVDTGDHAWRTFVSIPVLVQFSQLESFRFQLTSRDPKPFALPGIDPRLWEIVASTGESIGLLGDLLAREWNEGRLPTESGEHLEQPIVNNGHIAGPLGPVACQITAAIRVKRTLYFGALPLDEVSGFADEATGRLTTRGFTTAAIDMQDVSSSWQKVEDEKALAVRPTLRMEAVSYAPLFRETQLDGGATT